MEKRSTISRNGNLPLRSVLSVADFTSPGLIIPGLRGQDAPTVIQELGAALRREGRVPDMLPFYHAALNREYLCSTVTDPGWAWPHAQVRGLKQPCFALGRWETPRAWMKSDPRPVSLVFLFAIPETDARAYINLICGLARLRDEPHRVELLLRARDASGMLRALKLVKLRALQPMAA